MSAPLTGLQVAVLGSVSLLAIFGQSPKSLPSQKAEIREIKATGCVRKPPEGRCLLLVTLDGETTYSFVVTPKPDIGTVVTIQGKPHQGSTICGQGIQVDVTDWEPTGDKCSE